MKFIKPFYGVRSGEIYPVHFLAGDECPAELQEVAILTGAVGEQAEPVQIEKPAKVSKKK